MTDLVERRWIGVVPNEPGARVTRLKSVSKVMRDQGMTVTEWVPLAALEAAQAQAAGVRREASFTGVPAEVLRERIARAACEAGHHAWPTTDAYNDRAEKRAWLQIADAVINVLTAASSAKQPEGERPLVSG